MDEQHLSDIDNCLCYDCAMQDKVEPYYDDQEDWIAVDEIECEMDYDTDHSYWGY